MLILDPYQGSLHSTTRGSYSTSLHCHTQILSHGFMG